MSEKEIDNYKSDEEIAKLTNISDIVKVTDFTSELSTLSRYSAFPELDIAPEVSQFLQESKTELEELRASTAPLKSEYTYAVRTARTQAKQEKSQLKSISRPGGLRDQRKEAKKALKEARDNRKDTVDFMSLLVSRFTGAQNESSRQNESAKKNIKQAKKRYKSTKIALKEAIEKAEEARQKREDYDKKVEKIEKKIEEARRKAQDIKAKLQEYKSNVHPQLKAFNQYLIAKRIKSSPQFPQILSSLEANGRTDLAKALKDLPTSVNPKTFILTLKGPLTMSLDVLGKEENQAEIEKIKNEIDDLKNNTPGIDKDKKDIEGENKDLKDKNEELSSENKKIDEKMAYITSQLDAPQEPEGLSEEEKAELKSQRDAYQTEYKDLSTQIETIDVTIKNLVEQMNKAQQENDQKTMQQLMEQINNARQSRDSFSNQRDTLTQKYTGKYLAEKDANSKEMQANEDKIKQNEAVLEAQAKLAELQAKLEELQDRSNLGQTFENLTMLIDLDGNRNTPLFGNPNYTFGMLVDNIKEKLQLQLNSPNKQNSVNGKQNPQIPDREEDDGR